MELGDMLFYGGIGVSAIGAVMLIVISIVFKVNKQKLISKINNEL